MAFGTAYEFGDFRFEPFNARLIHNGRVIPMTAKATETLRQLVDRPDLLVRKEALITAVWPDTAVDDNNLNQQISFLRKTLGQDGQREFIETVPRLGYRFVSPVRKVQQGLVDAAPPTIAQESPGRIHRGRTLRFGVPLVIVALAAVIAVSEWRPQHRLADETEATFERGEALLSQGDARGAVQALQTAIELNPRHARAYASLAHALNRYSSRASMVEPPQRSASVEAAERSVAIDPRCGGCQGTLGFFLFYHEWQWARAEAHLREAIRLEPDLESIRNPYAMLLVATGRVSEALTQIDFALSKRPFEIGWQLTRMSILYANRQYEDAIAAADRALAINDTERGAWEWRSKALFQLGRGDEAINALAKVAFAEHASGLERAVKEGGTEAGLRELLRITEGWGQRSEQSWRRGPWLLLLNDTERALAELQIAYDTRKYNMMYLAVDPVYGRIRNHPRYRSLLAAMGLATAGADAPTGSH